MKLFSNKDERLSRLTTKPFKLEKEIQNLVENNLDELFNIQMVRSEFPIKNFRFDTLCFDKETNSFVVIEYKLGRNFSVIDQGYTYMSIMLNNKSDFILEYNERLGESLKRNDVDWSQSRVIFISTDYTEYQKHSVNFKDVPFELWVMRRFENDMISMIEHKNNSRESITKVSSSSESVVSKVSKEVKVYTEDYILNKSINRPEWILEKYYEIKERILNLGEVEIKPNGSFIRYYNNKPFADFVIYDQGISIILNMKKGTLNDPNRMMDVFKNDSHWGEGDYYINIKQNMDIDLDYLMFLINQSYQNKI